MSDPALKPAKRALYVSPRRKSGVSRSIGPKAPAGGERRTCNYFRLARKKNSAPCNCEDGVSRLSSMRRLRSMPRNTLKIVEKSCDLTHKTTEKPVITAHP